LEAVVDRALEIAMAPPRGPVYLTLPREVLAEPQVELTMASPPRRHLGGRLYPDPESIKSAARILGAAQNPLIITSSVGRDPEAVAPLVHLAETFAIPVVEFCHRYMCFPTSHPMHLGFSPKPFLESADAILIIDSDVPWYPSLQKPKSSCQIIHMDIDPLYSRYPIRGFPRDLAIRSDPAVGVPMLAQALARSSKLSRKDIAARLERTQAIHDQQRARWRDELKRVQSESSINPVWVSHCINEIKNDDTIIVNEYDLALTQVEFPSPGTFFSSTAAGGLGWGLGASMGIKLGIPEKLVIAVQGDGSYMFGNPTPCHFVSQALGLPVLNVIFNNGGWDAVRSATRRLYPDGWAVKTDNFPLTALEPSPDYEVLVTASGGYGERVEEASEVKPALNRALKVVKEEERQAVLNIICTHT
jgi:acetolactate synthase-1/2/3 large subunit